MTQEKLKLDIDGIHCNSCKKIIEDSVKKLEGIKHVSVNYEKQTCSVSFDNQKIKKETIIAAIDDAGYGCSISDTDEKKNRGMDKIRVLAFILGVIAIALVIYRFSENIAV
ncbi:MAG: cation transporter, partial [Candidatus Aenigmarchaeota archaeon]|nr:cation transporter [Candidatus Aenigmarchaeota archaeon]